MGNGFLPVHSSVLFHPVSTPVHRRTGRGEAGQPLSQMGLLLSDREDNAIIAGHCTDSLNSHKSRLPAKRAESKSGWQE